MLRLYKNRRYYAGGTARRPEYRWCYAEQVDQAAPMPDRSNGWRYLGPREGETYRRQAGFGAGFRLRLPFPRLPVGPGHRWPGRGRCCAGAWCTRATPTPAGYGP
ncbi:unnamed protein product [Ectocarpus sp. CCAP 1310/34]|nr:unnamed protein product [Ectocarpus sp. CCAP 1310/34]